MGYEYWPEALEATIRYAADVAGVPVVVTENGIGTDDDAQRVAYYREALAALARCLARRHRRARLLRLVAARQLRVASSATSRASGSSSVDRETQKRTPKRSARLLGAVARANAFDPATFA